jgi:two-component sensor histidine kinase
LAKVDFNGYVKTLINGLFRAHGVDPAKVRLEQNIEDVSLGLDNAVPCGLIINELVSNSLKYAFPQDKGGKIGIGLRSINEDQLELTVSDDGIGIPEDLDFRKTESLGLHLVTILAEDQLEGQIELNRDRGTRYSIQFKLQRYKARV